MKMSIDISDCAKRVRVFIDGQEINGVRTISEAKKCDYGENLYEISLGFVCEIEMIVDGKKVQ